MDRIKIVKLGAGLIATALIYAWGAIGAADTGVQNLPVKIAAEIPEPAGVLLVALGGLLLHRRFRKKPK